MTRSALFAVHFTLVLAVMVFFVSREREGHATPSVTSSKVAFVPAKTAPGNSLPRFEDYPVAKIFEGTPADVDLGSHPDAAMSRTRLTDDQGFDTLFAGHYRVVEIGCGTACQGIWVVDLVDGTVFYLAMASSGVAYRPGSRLVVVNDPGFFCGHA